MQALPRNCEEKNGVRERSGRDRGRARVDNGVMAVSLVGLYSAQFHAI